MNNNKDKPEKSVNELTIIDGFTVLYPEIFAYFRSLYNKRKSELKAKLDNRPAQREKEELLTNERERTIKEVENSPLSGYYLLLSKPASEVKAYFDSFVSVIPQIINAASSETDIKPKEILQSVSQKYLQPDSTITLPDMDSIIKELSGIPEAGEALNSIAQSQDSMAAFAYYLLQMEGDNRYLQFVILTYNKLQEPKTNLMETKEFEKIEWLGTQKQLAELFLELEKNKWIEKIDVTALKACFTKSNSIEQVLKPTQDTKTKEKLYEGVYSPKFKRSFDTVKPNKKPTKNKE